MNLMNYQWKKFFHKKIDTENLKLRFITQESIYSEEKEVVGEIKSD